MSIEHAANKIEVSAESLADSMASLEKTITEFKARHDRLLAAAKAVLTSSRGPFVSTSVATAMLDRLSAAVSECEGDVQ